MPSEESQGVTRWAKKEGGSQQASDHTKGAGRDSPEVGKPLPTSASWPCTPYISAGERGRLEARPVFGLGGGNCRATILTFWNVFVWSKSGVPAGAKGSTQALILLRIWPSGAPCFVCRNCSPSLTAAIRAQRVFKTLFPQLPFVGFLERQYCLVVNPNCLGGIPPIL